jgi:putative PIN family toxin of toxin-antitoxin system
VGQKKGVAKRLRVVLDTNILVSALLFTGKASELVPLWRERRIVLLVSKKIIQEYLRVLSYPKFSLTDLEIQTLFHEEILPFIEAVKITKPFPSTCRDPADDHFLACAATGKADALISGDFDLLSLRKVGRCPILTLETFLNRLLHI